MLVPSKRRHLTLSTEGLVGDDLLVEWHKTVFFPVNSWVYRPWGGPVGSIVPRTNKLSAQDFSGACVPEAVVGLSEGDIPSLHKGRGAQGRMVEKGQDSRGLKTQEFLHRREALPVTVSVVVQLGPPLPGGDARLEIVLKGAFSVSQGTLW